MSDNNEPDAATRAKLTPNQRLERTDQTAYNIIAKERAAIEAKTAKLKALRLARDAELAKKEPDL